MSADAFLADATRRIVAWIVEDTPLPNCKSAYADAPNMEHKEQFIVVCDYLSPAVAISSDPRAKRVSQDECRRIFGIRRHDGTVYLTIDWVEVGAAGEVFGFVIKNDFGYLAGQIYRIVFKRDNGETRTEVQLISTK